MAFILRRQKEKCNLFIPWRAFEDGALGSPVKLLLDKGLQGKVS